MKKFYTHLLLSFFALLTSASMYGQSCSTVNLDPADVQVVGGTTYTCDGQMLTIMFTGDAAATGYRIRVGNNGAPNAFTNLDVKYAQETGAGMYSVDIAIPNGSNGSQYTAVVDYTTDAFVAPFAALTYSDCFAANQQTFNVAIDPTNPTGITLSGDADKNDGTSDVCINTDFSLTVAGGINGDLGVVQWSTDMLFGTIDATGNTYDVTGGIATTTDFYVRRVDVLCGVTTMFATLNVTVNGIYINGFDLVYNDGGLNGPFVLMNDSLLCHDNAPLTEVELNNVSFSAAPANIANVEFQVNEDLGGFATLTAGVITTTDDFTYQTDEDKTFSYRVILNGGEACTYQTMVPESPVVSTYNVLENNAVVANNNIEFQIDGGMWLPYTEVAVTDVMNLCSGDIRFRFDAQAYRAANPDQLGNNLTATSVFFDVDLNNDGTFEITEEGGVNEQFIGAFEPMGSQYLFSNTYNITDDQSFKVRVNADDDCGPNFNAMSNADVSIAEFTAFPGAAVNDASFTANNVTKAVAVLDGGSVCENDNVTFTIDVDGPAATPLVIGGASGTISIYSKSLTAATYVGMPIASNMTVTDLTTMNQTVVSDTSFLAVIENSCGDSVVIGEININAVLNPTQPTSLSIVDSDMNTLTIMDNGLCAGENIMLTAIDGALGTSGTARYRFYGVAAGNIETELPGSNTINSSISVAHNTSYISYRVRISAGAPCPFASTPGTGVDFTVTNFTDNVAPVALNATYTMGGAPAASTCGDEMVTFTVDGAATLSTKPDAMFRFYDNAANVIATNTTGTVSINVERDTTINVIIIGGCNDVSGTIQSVTINWQSQSVAPTNITADASVACNPTLVEFTADGTLGDGAMYEFYDNAMNIIATQMSNAVTINVVRDTTVNVRIVGGCNDVTPATTTIAAPTATVDFQLGITGTVDISSTAALPGNVVCGNVPSPVNFDFDTNNDVVVGDVGYFEYVYTSLPTDMPIWANADSNQNGLLSTVITSDSTLWVRLTDCNGPQMGQSFTIDYQEPTDVSGLVVTYTDITDAMNPIDFDPNTTTLCFNSDVRITVSGVLLGENAVLQHRINGGMLTNTVVTAGDTSIVLNDVQAPFNVQFEVNGSCNMVANPIENQNVNVYTEIPDVTSLTIDKDNFCANSGEVVTLKTFTSSPVGNPPYTYDWSTFNPTTGIYTSIMGVDNTEDTLAVTPTKTTTYAVRIFGCNDSSTYVAQLVTVKDTSSVNGATIVTNADLNPVANTVCAGTNVNFFLQNGRRGFDAELFWYSTANGTEVQIGVGNPFTLNVTGDTTVYARYIGECNTSENSVSKSINVYDQNDVTMTVNMGAEEQCVGTMADLTALTSRSPMGGNFSGANVTGNVLNVQLGENVFTYTFNFGACSFSVNDTITGIAAPSVQLVAGSIVPNSCNGANVGAFSVEDINNEGLTINVTGSSYSSTMMTNATDSIVTFTGLASGVYVVNAANGLGCNSTFNVTITSAAGLSAKIDTAASSLLVCNGSATGAIKIVGTGGVSPYEYTFANNVNNYSTKNDTTGLNGAEVFDIKVRDANGCVFNVGDDISLPMNSNISTLTLNNIVEPSCFAIADGRFDAVAAGGQGPYQYSLDGGPFQTSSRFDSLSVGVYTVTVLNSVMFAGNIVPGCPRNFVSPLLGPDSISTTVDITGGDPINGYDVTITAAGGRGGFELSLNGGAFDTQFSFTALVPGDYTFTVRDVNGCTRNGAFTLMGATGINNVDDVISSVYPNPFDNTLTLVGKNLVNAEVILTDINGKVMATEKTIDGDKVVISTSDIAKGVYLVRVINNNQSTVKRVVKQ